MTNISTQINMSQYAREQMIQNFSARMQSVQAEQTVNKTDLPDRSHVETKFNYDEYIEFCKQHAVLPNPDNGKTIIEKSLYTETIRPIHVGEAMETYSQAEHKTVESLFEAEA